MDFGTREMICFAKYINIKHLLTVFVVCFFLLTPAWTIIVSVVQYTKDCNTSAPHLPSRSFSDVYWVSEKKIETYGIR